MKKTTRGLSGRPGWHYCYRVRYSSGGFLFVALFIATYLGFQWFFDLRVERTPIGHGLAIGYALMVLRHFAASAFDRQQHGREFSLSDRHEAEVQALHFPLDKIRRSRLAGAASVVAFFGFIEMSQVVNGNPLVTPWIQLHDSSATMVLALLMGWLFGRFIFFSLSFDSVIGTISQLPPPPQKSDVDLLNLDNLYVFGRSGLPTALVWLVGFGIGIFFLPVSSGHNLWLNVPIFAISLGVGLAALLRPALNVRGLIRAAKCEELARLEPMLPQARDDAFMGDESTHGRLTDLLAYKDRVESTSEWPFDSSTLLRFVLYLLIPVCSMVAGALVDRVVDIVLG